MPFELPSFGPGEDAIPDDYPVIEPFMLDEEIQGRKLWDVYTKTPGGNIYHLTPKETLEFETYLRSPDSHIAGTVRDEVLQEIADRMKEEARQDERDRYPYHIAAE